MLAALLNVPNTIDDWNFWSFALRDQTTLIQQAIQTQSNGQDVLFQYQIDPIPFNQIEDWLARVQQTLDDINDALGIQGTDIEGVDLNDDKQKAAWIYNIWQQYSSAADILGVS